MKVKFLFILVLLFFLSGCGNGVKIIKSAASEVSYEEYSDDLISLKIPKGWKVDFPNKMSYSGFSFKVYNPADKNYGFVFTLKLSGFLKTEEARMAFEKKYPKAAYGKLSAINPQTTEAFYKVWTDIAKYCNEVQLKQEYFPHLNDFKVIQNIGKSSILGDVLRATFKNSDDELMQGLFIAKVYDPGTYIVEGHDFAPLSTYHNIMMYAPDVDFNDWESIYTYCLSSVIFTEKYVKEFQKEEKVITSFVNANQSIYEESVNELDDLWEKRDNSYDITIQKQRDTTLNYERVYDTENGNVYLAYVGFTDNHSGEKYKKVTDDMYTSSISGYIEK